MSKKWVPLIVIGSIVKLREQLLDTVAEIAS